MSLEEGGEVRSGWKFGKAFTVGIACSLLAMTAAACGSSSKPTAVSSSAAKRKSPVTITFWGWDPNYPKEVALFNQTHKSIHVNYIAQPAGDTGQYPKLLSAIKAHTGPDVAQIEYDKLPQFVATGGILNLAKLGAGKYQKQFLPTYWKEVDFGDGIWAIPQDGGPTGVYYNSKLVKEYDLKIPKTYAELATEAIALHRAHPGVYLANFSPDPSWLMISMWQAGARWYTIKNGKWYVGIDTPASEKVAAYWERLIRDHAVSFLLAGSTPYYAALNHGQVVMLTTARWQMNGLRAEVPSWSGVARSALLPQWSLSHPVYPTYGGSSMVILKTAKHPRAALTFIDWLDTNPKSETLGVEKGWGWIAARNGSKASILHGTLAYFGNSHFNRPFWTAAESKATPWSFGPDLLSLSTELSDALSGVPDGSTTVGKALVKVEQEQLSTLKAEGISAVAAPGAKV